MARRIAVAIFMPSHGEAYADRFIRYLPEIFSKLVYAENEESFKELTFRTAGSWQLLLIEKQVLSRSISAVSNFLNDNPNVTVGIEISPTETAFVSRLTGIEPVQYAQPANIDEWLHEMHSLITTAEQESTF